MSVISNVVITSSNANVYVYSVAGVAVGDIVQGANISQADNLRVRIVYSNANVVKVDRSITTYTNEDLSFTNLLEGQSLYATNSIQGVFLRARPGYLPDYDPSLPKHDQLTANLTIWANAKITVSNIGRFPDPSPITANILVAAGASANVLLVPVSSTQDVTVGSQAVTANITTAANATVTRVYANGNILISGSVSSTVINVDEPIYLYPRTSFIRALMTTVSNTVFGNIILLPLETVDTIVVGSVVSSSNIAQLVDMPDEVKVRKIFPANNTVQIDGITANITIPAGEYVEFNSRPTVGAVRIRGEIIWYERVWTANSTLTNLTRNVAGTTNATISGNIWAGNLVSVLGLQTVRS